MPLPRAPIDLARRGAWSAETTHAPRVPDVAVAAHRRAQPISKTFSRGVTSARASYWLGFLIESARVGPRNRRGMLSTIMEPPKNNPVPLGASQIPTHNPSRRCVAVVLNLPLRPPCASRRDTRHEQRDVTYDEHHGPVMPTAHSLHRRANTRGRVRRGIFFSGRRRRVVVGGAALGRSGTTPNATQPAENQGRARRARPNA